MRTICLVLVMFLAMASPAQAPPGLTPDSLCTLETLHPIQIELRQLDATVPGRWLRVEVQVQSERDLSDVAIELHADPGVELSGSRKAAWATLAAVTPRVQSFDVRVPDVRAPQQVRVQVRGRAEGSWLERGAVLQLLPQGRHHTPIASESAGRTVLEYRGAARREP